MYRTNEFRCCYFSISMRNGSAYLFPSSQVCTNYSTKECSAYNEAVTVLQASVVNLASLRITLCSLTSTFTTIQGSSNRVITVG